VAQRCSDNRGPSVYSIDAVTETKVPTILKAHVLDLATREGAIRTFKLVHELSREKYPDCLIDSNKHSR